MTTMNVSKHFIKREKERTAGECEITNANLQEVPISSQSFLRVLKEKGAPVEGMCFLSLDEHYVWTTYVDLAFMSTHVKWVPRLLAVGTKRN